MPMMGDMAGMQNIGMALPGGMSPEVYEDLLAQQAAGVQGIKLPENYGFQMGNMMQGQQGVSAASPISMQQPIQTPSPSLFAAPQSNQMMQMPAPAQRPVGIGMPLEPGQQQFRGGLRPAPRGYRPPGGPRQRMGR
jgi:hypothetical protein